MAFFFKMKSLIEILKSCHESNIGVKIDLHEYTGSLDLTLTYNFSMDLIERHDLGSFSEEKFNLIPKILEKYKKRVDDFICESNKKDPKIHRIPTDIIVSAFQNEIDPEKLEKYTAVMKEEMLSNNFPPIIGYFSCINWWDIEDKLEFMNGRIATERDLHKTIWKVTDGHHRTLAAIEAKVPYLYAHYDRSAITKESDLKLFDQGEL